MDFNPSWTYVQERPREANTILCRQLSTFTLIISRYTIRHLERLKGQHLGHFFVLNIWIEIPRCRSLHLGQLLDLLILLNNKIKFIFRPHIKSRLYVALIDKSHKLQFQKPTLNQHLFLLMKLLILGFLKYKQVYTNQQVF